MPAHFTLRAFSPPPNIPSVADSRLLCSRLAGASKLNVSALAALGRLGGHTRPLLVCLTFTDFWVQELILGWVPNLGGLTSSLWAQATF